MTRKPRRPSHRTTRATRPARLVARTPYPTGLASGDARRRGHYYGDLGRTGIVRRLPEGNPIGELYHGNK